MKMFFVIAGLALPGAAIAGGGWDFQDGTAAEGNFLSTATRGQVDQVLGRVYFFGGGGIGLNGMDYFLAGTRTGLSNLKMWTSDDATFGGDTQFGSTAATDPGASALSFTQGSPYLGGNSFYVFLTADVAANATGSATAAVTAINHQASLSGFGGNDPMSAASTPLPVTISGFHLD